MVDSKVDEFWFKRVAEDKSSRASLWKPLEFFWWICLKLAKLV
jgi:hypothetical protein